MTTTIFDDEKISAQKKILRREILARLRSMPSDEKKIFDNALTKKFLDSSSYRRAKILMAYMSTAEEVQLNEIISAALAEEKIVAVPLIDGREMHAVQLPNLDAVEVGAYWIATVAGEKIFIDAEKINCVIVPGVAFDAECFRLGRGAAFYDKFLPRAVHAEKIALAYDCQIVEKVPTAPHDFPVDAVITPTVFFSA